MQVKVTSLIGKGVLRLRPSQSQNEGEYVNLHHTYCMRKAMMQTNRGGHVVGHCWSQSCDTFKVKEFQILVENKIVLLYESDFKV